MTTLPRPAPAFSTALTSTRSFAVVRVLTPIRTPILTPILTPIRSLIRTPILTPTPTSILTSVLTLAFTSTLTPILTFAFAFTFTSTLILTLGLAQDACAQQFEVLDLGAGGSTNQTWGISPNGFVAGYSSIGARDEGFVYDGEDAVFVGIPPGTSRSDMLSVNTLGEAVGKSGTTNESGQAILWHSGGPLESLGTLGGNRSAALSINELSQIVGWSQLSGNTESRPFLYDAQMTALPLLGGTQGQAEWINDAGQVVGTSTTDDDGLQQFAVLWENDGVTRLPPVFPGQNNLASYIHDNGDIAGSVRIPGPSGFVRRAAIWRDGEVYLTLGTLADGSPQEPFATSWASGVNASGDVVGMSVDAQGSLVPFLYQNGEMQRLQDLVPTPWVLTFLGSGAINDAGQIAVSGFQPGQSGSRALLLTPSTTGVETPPTQSPSRNELVTISVRGSRIVYSLAERARVRLTVHDVQGRLVSTLVERTEDAGSHELRWRERLRSSGDASVVASGVYFVRLETDLGGGTVRLVVLS
ncbi:MAG: hypothetical protein KC729_07125 [Candidatus Eisenbacteria bacterium]|uniref:T9SS type A sorting domain-containing protein n=1 Tax=Eiseniibacteriota bacterium TaxID=2212470 RepID=A0A956RPH0_UNCEI|nr:hypothetical protein [Candidatus Eisenbacteria bacterium]